MRLIVNGEPLEIAGGETFKKLLKELRIEIGRVAVEVNLSVIRKDDYLTYKLRDGDKVEIVNFVGGG